MLALVEQTETKQSPFRVWGLCDDKRFDRLCHRQRRGPLEEGQGRRPQTS